MKYTWQLKGFAVTGYQLRNSRPTNPNLSPCHFPGASYPDVSGRPYSAGTTHPGRAPHPFARLRRPDVAQGLRHGRSRRSARRRESRARGRRYLACLQPLRPRRAPKAGTAQARSRARHLCGSSDQGTGLSGQHPEMGRGASPRSGAMVGRRKEHNKDLVSDLRPSAKTRLS
jgi:hypothetical protein